jgi:hypothetical protein
VSRAEEEETTYVVQRELLALRHTHLDTAHTLELAQEEIRHLRSLVEANVSVHIHHFSPLYGRIEGKKF